MMTRRSFAGMFGKAGVILSLGSLISVTTACPAWLSNVYADILKYAPVALSAVASVLSILTGNGIVITPAISAIIALIKVAISDLQTAVTQYQNAPTGQKSGLLGAISEAVTVAESNIQKFWADLTIPDAKLSSLIEGLLGIVVSTLQGFQTQLPAPVTPVATQAKMMRAGLSKTIAVTPKVRSVAHFRKEFNALLTQSGEGQHSI